MRLAYLAIMLLATLPLEAQAKGKLAPGTIYAQSKGSVVKIVTFDANDAPLAQGSGFVVAKNRIITNYHVLSGSTFASVVFEDGSKVPVKSVVYSMPPEDVATVEAETGNRPSLSWGDQLQLKVGEAIYAIGAPSGLSASLSSGLISAFRMDNRDVFFIQITAIIAPGSSGGPLFNSQGEVVGITTSRLKDSDFGFAVGIGDIQLLPCLPPLPYPTSPH
jgi:serine protease Do